MTATKTPLNPLNPFTQLVEELISELKKEAETTSVEKRGAIKEK